MTGPRWLARSRELVRRWWLARSFRSEFGIQPRRLHIEHGVTYGSGGDTELKLDLAMPRGVDGPLPAVVIIPGGSWQTLAWPVLMEALLESLAGRGFVGVNIAYRLAPAARFPAQLEDCKAAVRWLRANASRYRIALDRIAALGPSAGGHLAALLGTTRPADGMEGAGGHAEQSSQVQAVVSLFGPMDLTDAFWHQNGEAPGLVKLLGTTYQQDPESYRQASPLTYARADSPPFLLMHGTADPLVPIGQSRLMAEKLRSLGVHAEMVELAGEGHGWVGPPLHQSIDQIAAFLVRQLGGKDLASQAGVSGPRP